MLNPFGYVTAGQRAGGPDHESIMKSVKQNITTNRTAVRDFIAKETNVQRRRDLELIFDTAEELTQQFEGHRQHEIRESAVYKRLGQKLFKLMQKQRHAGRKLFLVSVSNPLLGLDVVHFHYYTTIRGIKGSQLELMDPFINELQGTVIKTEFETEQKPIGLVNVPKSESSRQSAAGKLNRKKVKISHADLKNDIAGSLASIFVSHKIPIKWLDQNIDTSELPNALKKQVNVLINLNLVVEMSDEPLEPAVELPVNEDGFWDSDGSIEREVIRSVERSMEMENDNFVVVENDQVQPSNNNNEPLSKTKYFALKKKSAGQTKSFIDNSDNDDTTTPTKTKPADQMVTPKPCKLQRQSTPMMSTPSVALTQSTLSSGRLVELPRPNDSLASIGLPDEILNLEQIHTAPLSTPKPKKRSLGRSNTMEPSAMRSLDTDSEEEIISNNATAPSAAQNNQENISIASSQEIDELLKSINEMSNRFDKLEKSFKK